MDELKGNDYLTRPYLELVGCPDFSIRVWYAINRMREMTTEQLEQTIIMGVD